MSAKVSYSVFLRRHMNRTVEVGSIRNTRRSDVGTTPALYAGRVGVHLPIGRVVVTRR